MVTLANAGGHGPAVLVVNLHTHVACGAVEAPGRTHHLTCLAVLEGKLHLGVMNAYALRSVGLQFLLILHVNSLWNDARILEANIQLT